MTQILSKRGMLLLALDGQPAVPWEGLPVERIGQDILVLKADNIPVDITHVPGSRDTTLSSYTINAQRDGYSRWTVGAAASESGFSSGSASRTFTVIR